MYLSSIGVPLNIWKQSPRFSCFSYPPKAEIINRVRAFEKDDLTAWKKGGFFYRYRYSLHYQG